MKTHVRSGERDRRGAAVLIALILLVGLAGLAMAFMGTTISEKKEFRRSADESSAYYVAEGGLVEAWTVLRQLGREGFEELEYPLAMSGTTYTVSAEFGDEVGRIADDLVRIVCTAQDGLGTASVELIARVEEEENTLVGVLAARYLELDSNCYVDSYSSSLGTWAAQASNKLGSKLYASNEATIGSNGDVQLDTNCVAFGDVSCAPGGVVTVSGKSEVTGSTAPADEPHELPTVTWPGGSTGSLVLDGKKKTIGPGTFVYDELVVKSNATLEIKGPVTIYVKNKFVLDSNSSIAPKSGLPADLTVYVDDGATQVELSSNTFFVGSLVAPGCDVILRSNTSLCGAVVGDRIYMDSNSAVHIDEDLGAGLGSGEPVYELLVWRPTANPAP